MLFSRGHPDREAMKRMCKEHFTHCTLPTCSLCYKLRLRLIRSNYRMVFNLLFEEAFDYTFSNDTHDSTSLIQNIITGIRYIRNPVGFEKAKMVEWLNRQKSISITTESTLQDIARQVCTPIETSRRRQILENPETICTNAEVAYCVLLRFQPWSIETHKLFPKNTNARAYQLVFISRLLAKTWGPIILDVWLAYVIPFVLTDIDL